MISVASEMAQEGKVIPASCPLTSTGLLWYMRVIIHTGTHAHTKQTNVITKFKKVFCRFYHLTYDQLDKLPGFRGVV